MKVLGEGLIEKIFSSIGDESKRWAALYERVVKERDTATEFQILRELANRRYGKPKEHVEQTIKGEMTIADADRLIAEHFSNRGVIASPPNPEPPKVNVLERFEVEERRRSAAIKEFCLLGTGAQTDQQDTQATEPGKPKIRVEL